MEKQITDQVSKNPDRKDEFAEQQVRKLNRLSFENSKELKDGAAISIRVCIDMTDSSDDLEVRIEAAKLVEEFLASRLYLQLGHF